MQYLAFALLTIVFLLYRCGSKIEEQNGERKKKLVPLVIHTRMDRSGTLYIPELFQPSTKYSPTYFLKRTRPNSSRSTHWLHNRFNQTLQQTSQYWLHYLPWLGTTFCPAALLKKIKFNLMALLLIVWRRSQSQTNHLQT